MPIPDPRCGGRWYRRSELDPARRTTAVKGPDPKLIGYVLLSPGGSHWWHGPGFRPVGAALPRALWPDRASAARAARALNRALGLGAVPAPLRIA